jgi:hypothetical protein
MCTLIAVDKWVPIETTWTMTYSSVVVGLAFRIRCTRVRHNARIDTLPVETSGALWAVVIALATWFFS